jgi:hypothetical protein
MATTPKRETVNTRCIIGLARGLGRQSMGTSSLERKSMRLPD